MIRNKAYNRKKIVVTFFVCTATFFILTGRLVFLIVEAIRGKRVDPEKEGYVNLIGIALLMGLMVLVMFNDIRKLFI